MNKETLNTAQGSEKDMDRYDDEIDLFDLIDDIRDNVRWVLIGLILTLTLAVAYLYVAKPVYKTESMIKPVNSKYLVELLSPQLQEIYKTDEAKIFALAKSALSSSDYRKAFYHQKLSELKAIEGFYSDELTEGQNYQAFAKRFSFNSSGKKDSEVFYTVSFQAGDAQLAANLLNDYVAMALTQRLSDLEQTVNGALAANVKSLTGKANSKRDQYLAQKSLRILELREALSIAKAVGQTKPVYHSLDIVMGSEPPMYLLGSIAISAEIKALNNRAETAKNLKHGEDFFIKGLPRVLAQIDVLQSVNVDFSNIKIASIDSQAVVPLKPIKPRKLLIAALSIVAGIFVGIFMALVAAAFTRHNDRIAERRARRRAEKAQS